MRKILMALSLCPLSVFAAEKAVKEADVPKPVVEAVKAKYADATVKGYAQEHEGKKVVYEVELDRGGKELDVDIAADGTVVSEESQIDPATVPDAVKDSLAKSKYAKWTLESAEKVVVTGKEDEPSYELVVAQGGKKMEAVFDATGKLVKTEAHKGEPKRGEVKREVEHGK